MTYDPHGDGCDNCGGEDHTCDTCPEFITRDEFLAHVATHNDKDDHLDH